MSYSIEQEASRILHEVLLADPALDLATTIVEAAKKVHFTGNRSKPFVPAPVKLTESSASLTALVAAAASAIAEARYGIGYQDIEVNTDAATLFLESVLLPTINGRSYGESQEMMKELSKMDLHDMVSPIRRYATSIYQTKDGRWFQLHGSMNADRTMEMLGVKMQKVTRKEAAQIYKEKVAQWDSHEIERVANDESRQAGVICYTPDEFFKSKQGKIMGKEPLWTAKPIPGPRKQWPSCSDFDNEYKPLKGIRIIDYSRVIASPAISKILAVLGADVIRVSYSEIPEYATTMVDLQTGKRDVNLNLKTPEGKAAFSQLLQGADVLVDGYRPGVLERLGFTSTSMRKINPSLIYMRENCYGFKGPLANRSGWQQISDCLVGIAYLQGQFLGLDHPTGLVGAAAILQALIKRTTEDTTYDIDISLTQYNIWFYRLGTYSEAQRKELVEQDPDFHPHHLDDMTILTRKTHSSLVKVHPQLVQPEYFWEMDGSEWGIKDPIKILAPAFKFSKSKLEYMHPSGRRGRSKAML
ncbi:hypothetical protein ACJQWK_09318 [Exserohilum turcicum]